MRMSAPTAANLSATPMSGAAPLKVNFTMKNDGAGEPKNWTLSYGDGNGTNGTKLPANASYTYPKAGDYSALFVIHAKDGTSSNDSVAIKVTAATKPAGSSATGGPPSKTSYTSGPLVGCVSEIGAGNCGAVVRGTTDTVFGLWIMIEPGHVGMNFTATGGFLGDSDAWFFDDPKKAPLADDVNNGGKEAGGKVPLAAKWLLVFPWAGPSASIKVTFK